MSKANEIGKIVWLEPIDRLDYVRELFRPKRGYKRSSDGVRLVGYDTTPCHGRRVFLLFAHDRDSDPGGIYAQKCPCEAVDPRTVVPGKGGQQTPRCTGATKTGESHTIEIITKAN